MDDKDKQELEALKAHLSVLQVMAHQRDHELMSLQIYLAKQSAWLDRLTALTGLLNEDLDRPDALTHKDRSILLRLRRSLN